jgi:hypothetical protein
VDLLVVERGYLHRPTSTYTRQPWEDLVGSTPPNKRPRVVLESRPANAQSWTKGPVSKPSTTWWQTMGYVSRCRHTGATHVGGAILQARLLVVRIQLQWSHLWVWATEETESNLPRPMSNLLTPPGLVPRNSYFKGLKGMPDAATCPMPEQLGAFIQTEKGARRVTPEELTRGLGVPKSWKLPVATLTDGLLRRTTSVFHWEYLSESLLRKAHSKTIETGPLPAFEDLRDRTQPSGDQTEGHFVPTTPFSWTPPDLRPGQPWYEKRTANLAKAAATFSDPTSVIEEGLQALETHRNNYDSEGPAPKCLQLLWWEFPSKHWIALKDGSRVNFLVPPAPNIHDNAVMDAEQLLVTAEFVDELLDLGVVGTLADGKEILTTAPLFVVPKEGQEGQWRVIADML